MFSLNKNKNKTEIIIASGQLTKELKRSFYEFGIKMYKGDEEENIPEEDILYFLSDDIQELPYILLYVLNNKVIGCVYMEHCDYVYEKFVEGGAYKISNLFVLKEYRQMNIASKLLRRCEKIAKEDDVHTIVSDFNESNIPSKNWHYKNGFTYMNTNIQVIKNIWNL